MPAVAHEEFVNNLVRGGELLGAGKVIEAKEYLERAHTLEPKNERGRNLLGLTYFKLGLFDRAAEIYETLINDNPVDPTLRVNLGLVYLKTHSLQRAIREFEMAVDLAPDYQKAHNYLGLALAQAGQYADARSHFVAAGSDAMAEKMDFVLSGGAVLPRAETSPPTEFPSAQFTEIPESEVEVIEGVEEVEGVGHLAPPVMEESPPATEYQTWEREGHAPPPVKEESDEWSFHLRDASFAEQGASVPVTVESGGVVLVVPPEESSWETRPWEERGEELPREPVAAPKPIPLVLESAALVADEADFGMSGASGELAAPVADEADFGMSGASGEPAAEDASESNEPSGWDTGSDGRTMHYGEEEFRFDDIPESAGENSGRGLGRSSEPEGIGAVAAAAAEAVSAEAEAAALQARPFEEDAQEPAQPSRVIPFGVVKPRGGVGLGTLLSQLAPSSEVLKGPVTAPFEVREEGAAISVAGELLTRVEDLLLVTGAVKLEPELRRFRGQGTNQSFGEGGARLMRATGRGVLVVGAKEGQRFTAIDLEDEGAYFREEVVYAFEQSVTFENWLLSSEEVAGVALVNLWGKGKVLLRLEGALRAHQVRVDEPATVPLERLVGWFGNVTPRLVSLAVAESGSVVKGGAELSGEGFVLFTAPMG
jgi:uncharacterized protein (AIM24 family)